MSPGMRAKLFLKNCIRDKGGKSCFSKNSKNNYHIGVGSLYISIGNLLVITSSKNLQNWEISWQSRRVGV